MMLLWIFLLVFGCNSGITSSGIFSPPPGWGDEFAGEDHSHEYSDIAQHLPPFGVYLSDQRSPCQKELGRDGRGRYPRLIEREFPKGAVQCGVNMHCACNDHSLMMICVIEVFERSIPYDVVMRRLDRTNLQALRPFFLFSSMDEQDPIFAFRLQSFRDPNGVTALLELDVNDQRAQSLDDFSGRLDGSLTRYGSSPSTFNHPERRIPRRLCNAGDGESICPIMHTLLKHGDIVYVLKRDKTKLSENKPVICISAEGLRKLADRNDQGNFVDPFHRTDDELLSIAHDFDAYVIGNSNIPQVNTWDRELHRDTTSVPSEAGPSNVNENPSDGNTERAESPAAFRSKGETEIQLASNTYFTWIIVGIIFSSTILAFALLLTMEKNESPHIYKQLF